jgi:hypothetical protein
MIDSMQSQDRSPTSFRWESVVALLSFVWFWLNDSAIATFSRAMPPGEIYERLVLVVPFFVLTPALAISTLRNKRANQVSKLTAWIIIVFFVLLLPTYVTLSRIIRAPHW